MSDEKEKDQRRKEDWRETFFLPPLKMILSFFDKEARQREKERQDAEKRKKDVGKNVEKLIEKLSEKEE